MSEPACRQKLSDGQSSRNPTLRFLDMIAMHAGPKDLADSGQRLIIGTSGIGFQISSRRSAYVHEGRKSVWSFEKSLT